MNLLNQIILYLGFSSQLCFADTPSFDVSGFVPGQSPRAAASAFIKAHPDWQISDPADLSWSDALANDCVLSTQGLWICKVKATARESTDIFIELQYSGPEAPLADRRLGLARLILQWKTPWKNGWQSFLSSRNPNSTGGVLNEKKGRNLLTTLFPTPAINSCKNYKTAGWQGYDTQSLPTSISAIGNIDTQNGLCSLVIEVTAKGWERVLNTPTIPLEVLP